MSSVVEPLLPPLMTVTLSPSNTVPRSSYFPHSLKTLEPCPHPPSLTSRIALMTPSTSETSNLMSRKSPNAELTKTEETLPERTLQLRRNHHPHR